jgi:hypothetical protein
MRLLLLPFAVNFAIRTYCCLWERVVNPVIWWSSQSSCLEEVSMICFAILRLDSNSNHPTFTDLHHHTTHSPLKHLFRYQLLTWFVWVLLSLFISDEKRTHLQKKDGNCTRRSSWYELASLLQTRIVYSSRSEDGQSSRMSLSFKHNQNISFIL